MTEPVFDITCRRCQETKPNHAFRRHRSGSRGYEPVCKACRAERSRETKRAYMVRYRAENPDYVRELNRRRYERDGERIREQSRRWRAEHREQALATQAAYREHHRDELREYQAEYRRVRGLGSQTPALDDESSKS